MGGSWSRAPSCPSPCDTCGATWLVLGIWVATQNQCLPCLIPIATARPVKDHYLPDLHHLRLELEEAVTPEGHAVRFGFNPLEFENFSWRGYAHMAPIQVGRASMCLLIEAELAVVDKAGSQDLGWRWAREVTPLFCVFCSPGSWPG